MAIIEQLENGLVLRSVEGESDIERFVAFNASFNNPAEGQTCACLLRHHPGTALSDYWLVEDPAKGEMVSSICLIPWECSYAGVSLRVAMLEMVLTHPAYRGQGLVRKQIKHFLNAVQSRGFDLGIIWGIPYYYRQYGYGYCLDGDTFESLPAWQIPGDAAGPAFPFRLRPAGLEDIERLAALYDQAVSPLQLYVRRNAQYWEYLLRWAGYPVQVVEAAQGGSVAGYVVLTRDPGSSSLRILESSIPSAEVAIAVLRHFNAEAPREIRIAWPQNATLAALARSLGSRTMSGGQWLLRIPDIPRFLHRIAPVLADRLASSAWQGLSLDFRLNFYREAFCLRFAAGKLAAVESQGFVDSSMGADGGDMCIPPEAFLRLAFGYRNLEQLQDAWPDILVKPEIRSLVDVLFPPMLSYLHTPYHFMKAGQP